MMGKESWRTIALGRLQNRNATFYSHLSGTMWKINPSLYIYGDCYGDKDQANLMFTDNFSTKYLYICLEKNVSLGSLCGSNSESLNVVY